MAVGDDVSVLRGRLVDRLIDAGRIRTERVAEAFRAVPRHLFLPGMEPAGVYVDEVIPVKWQPDGRVISSSSQPAIMAEMLEQLSVEQGQRVLEIGTGTGYNAALLAHLVGTGGSVTTLDIDADLTEQASLHLRAAGLAGIDVVCADGADGWPPGAPYDRIIVTAGARELSPAWMGQLAERGRLVLPLSLRGTQRSVAFEAAGDHLVSASIIDCGFMPLRGTLAGADPVRPLGERSGLFVRLEDPRPVDTAALYTALRRPGTEIRTGVTATAGDVWGGLGLWLVLHDPSIGTLGAEAGAVEAGLVPPLVTYSGMTSTAVLVGEWALAALTRSGTAGSFALGARAFGPDATALAERLAAHVREWDTRGRPSTSTLRIRAYPLPQATTNPARTFLDTPHTRLVFDW